MSCMREKLISIVLLVFFTAGNALAFDWQDLWQRPDQRAYELLQGGDSAAAAGLFDDPQWRGVSHYRAGEFEQAQKEFTSQQDNSGLYNQGVTAVQQGDYEAAVENFETLLERSPDHVDGKHNLEIARELAQQQEQQQEEQQGDQDQQQDSGDQQQDKDQQQQNSSDGEGQSQQAESDTEGESGQSESNDEQRGGELAANPEDAQSGDQQQSKSEEQANSESDRQQQAQQDADQQPEGQQQGGAATQEGADDEQSQAAAMSQAGPTEGEQATEQWLRRIPDDPSQLLRNKIKLNHMIEHADVQDMREPW